ncbi:MAG TPA: hypothetical protein VL978_14015 [Puia sp.]|nr:hypothetical protein [Puia sp.]
MNDHQNEYASRIAAYLENRLSPEEREAFKRQLSENDELRLQYVDALMNRAGNGPGIGAVVKGATEPMAEEVREVEPWTEPAAEPVPEPGAEAMPEPIAEVMPEPGAEVEPERVAEIEPEPVAEVEPAVKEASEPDAVAGELPATEVVEEGEHSEYRGAYKTLGEQGAREAWEAGWPGGKKKASGGFLGSGWIVGITVLLLIVAGVVMYMMSRHQDLWDKTVATITGDSAKGGNKLAAAPVSGVDSAKDAGHGGAGSGGVAGAGGAAGAGVDARQAVSQALRVCAAQPDFA